MGGLSMKKHRTFFMIVAFLTGLAAAAWGQEMTEYEGRKLTPLAKQRTTFVESVPGIDLETYRLRIVGRVGRPLELRYDEVLAFPLESRVIDFHCVEGWGYQALWTGPKVADIIAEARPEANVKTVVFYAAGGTYSSALPLDYVRSKGIILASRINNVPLSPGRGFPFMVAAESKYGYKWVQWVERIELSEKDYFGYWEKRGYSNRADIRD
jgi:DMSO/TMAO reductase YedYZ molybdopterin-dependent catalytic subunit